MHKQPLVSVVIATRDRAEYLKKAITSIFDQTYKNIELIIADDNSTDKTLEIIQPYLKDSGVHYIYQEKQEGPGQTRNNAIKTAQGKYIAVLDSDDFWSNPQKTEKQVSFLENNSDYVLVGGGAVRIDKNGKEVRRILPPENDKNIRNVIFFKNPFAHSTVLFKKSAWQKVGGYDKNLNCGEDWDLWLKLGKLGKLYNFQENFACYLQDEQNISNLNIRRNLRLNIKSRRKYRQDYPNFWKAFFLGWFYYFYSFFPFKKQLYPISSKLRRIIFGY